MRNIGLVVDALPMIHIIPPYQSFGVIFLFFFWCYFSIVVHGLPSLIFTSNTRKMVEVEVPRT